jgi:hypothetical protein
VEERRGLRVEGRGEGAFEFGKKAGGVGGGGGRGEKGSGECGGAMSLLEVLEHTHETRNLLITLASICRCSVESDEERGDGGNIWECAPVEGHELLDGLYGLVERGGESSMSVLSGLLRRSIAPLLSVTSSCMFTAQVTNHFSMVGYRLSRVCSPGHVQTSLQQRKKINPVARYMECWIQDPSLACKFRLQVSGLRRVLRVHCPCPRP